MTRASAKGNPGQTGPPKTGSSGRKAPGKPGARPRGDPTTQTVRERKVRTPIAVALKGDTNLDGKHTAADAVMAKAAALGKLTPSPVQEAVANANGDSKITAADAVMIKAITLGKTEVKW